MDIETNISYLQGVGPKVGIKLKRLGIETIRDLLFYYPRTWQDFTKPRKISSLRVGEDVIVKASVSQIRQSRTRRRWMSIVEAELIDDTGAIKAIWFNQPFLMKILRPGMEFLFAGKVNWDFKNKAKTLSVSQYETKPKILAIYPETEGLTSKFLRKLIQEVQGISLEDYLTDDILKANNLIDLESAIWKIHCPKDSKDIEVAKKRLAFDELFLISLRMLKIKKELSQEKCVSLKHDNKILKNFTTQLPFELTNAQRKAAWEIICDIENSRPMNRLLEGDVGSGKTVVAAMAVLVASQNKMQSVWLAPTEILANQHFVNVKKLLPDIKIGLMTSANKKSDLKKDDLIIGTHALLQKDVNIPNLALIVIDEQHRFGVKQRAHLRQQKDIIPHLLSMTATPIPRTMALSLYGDLDISIIDEIPKGRQKVITKVVDPKDRVKAYDFIEKEIKKGRQVFVVCPLIEEKDKLKVNLFEMDRKSAKKEFDKLSKEIFPSHRVGLLHGKMKANEKDMMMKKFKDGKIDILVSTAVIEVGIDIPNATVMMIESADRFGLAQLHQFRGRVGRGKHQSYCFLFSESWSENTKNRLAAMKNCNNGFELSEIDLKMRGPGELSGIRQSGVPDLRMASFSDIMLVKQAKKTAEKVVKEGLGKYPKLENKLREFELVHHLE